MNAADYAYAKLVRLAAVDGRITPTEEALLERYRRALRVSRSIHAQALTSARQGRSPAPAPPTAKAAPTLRMLARVALHDGVLDARERQRLEQVAAALGVDAVELAEIVVNAEHEAESRHGMARGKRLALAGGIALLSLGAVAAAYLRHASDAQAREDRAAVQRLRLELGESAEVALRAEEELVRASLAEQEARRSVLERRVLELEVRPSAQPSPATEVPGVAGELAELRAALDELRRRTADFKGVERECSDALVLVLVQYEWKKGSRRETLWSTGTGFFASPSGHVVTAKHVVEPWKYDVEDARLERKGYQRADGFVAIWPHGARVARANGELDLSTSYNSLSGTLRVERVGADRFERSAKEGHESDYHVLDSSDVALLKATVQAPVRALALQPDEAVLEKLDPVLVLGFPHTLELFQNALVQSAPAPGEIRKIEKHIFTTAPIVSGNSGGPLLDRDGRAIGIASITVGDATLGGCVPVRFALELLPPSAELVAEAQAHERDDHPGAALDLADLAEQRGASAAELAPLCERLRARRDAALAAARARVAEGATEQARDELEELVGAFGPRWGKEALESLRTLR